MVHGVSSSSYVLQTYKVTYLVLIDIHVYYTCFGMTASASSNFVTTRNVQYFKLK